MTIDLNKYKLQIEGIKKLHESGFDLMNISNYTFIPLIAVAYIIGELYGYTDEINKKIETHKKFYKIENIIPLTKE